MHVVDTREDHWRRILVVDMDEKESLKVINLLYEVRRWCAHSFLKDVNI